MLQWTADVPKRPAGGRNEQTTGTPRR